MKDIYDIKDVLLGFPINFVYSIIIIIFILILFIVYKYILKQSNDLNIYKETPKEVIKKDFKKILRDFENSFLEKDKSIFYSNLIEILREILEEKWNKNISKMTLDEISSLNITEENKLLIKSIYFKEYMKEIEDNKDIRLKFINNISKLIN